MAPVKKTSTTRSKKSAPEAKSMSTSSEAVVHSARGGKEGSIALPAELFGVKWNENLVHQVMLGVRANARPTTAHTKFRGEVAGGGKKPWKQKGTGRARHGSTRSPIWVGGGVTHGPRAERDYSVKINKKMRRAALLSVLSRKYKDGELIFVDSFSTVSPKTKEARQMLETVSKAAGTPELVTKKRNAALIAFASKDMNTERSFRNLESVSYDEVRNLNVADILGKRYLIIEHPAEAFAVLSGKLTK